MVKSWGFRRGQESGSRLVTLLLVIQWAVLPAALTGCGQDGSCRNTSQEAFVDSLNDMAADWLFVCPDSAMACALRAEKAAGGYSDGLCEAWSHQMSVCFLRMDFDHCHALYGRILHTTHNVIERLAAETQMMWICQRGSQNKAFFDHYDRALSHLDQIGREQECVKGRDKVRAGHAAVSFHLATAAYYMNLMQGKEARAALAAVDADGHVRRDKALLTCYWFLNGAVAGMGRMWEDGEQAVESFDCYLTAYSLAAYHGYVYFEAKAELALARLLSDAWAYGLVRQERAAELDYLCRLFAEGEEACSPDAASSLCLPGCMARDGRGKASALGSLWLAAEARLALGDVAFSGGDYPSALAEYEGALDLLNRHHQTYYPADTDQLLEAYDGSGRTPAGIVWARDSDTQTVPQCLMDVRERLSLAFSALGAKQESDYNRNAYLDLLDFTRQDRALESRVHAAARDNRALRAALHAVVALSVLFALLLAVYARMWRKRDLRQHRLLDDMSRWFMDVASMKAADKLDAAFDVYPWMKKEKRILHEVLRPYVAWTERSRALSGKSAGECMHMHDESVRSGLRVERDKRENVRKRAKVSLVYDVYPLIGRILHGVSRLEKGQDIRPETLGYVEELADEINRHNEVLTEWIRMNRGELALTVESFPLQPLFDVLGRGEVVFRRDGVRLALHPTSLWVKADKALTFFMLNTLADNARKFTPPGGKVEVRAEELADAVEISVEDTGCGLSESDVAVIRSSKVYDASKIGACGVPKSRKGQGFGLLNCKGIIEKYRKEGGLFAVCRLDVESRLGAGSRFSFRLPKGAARLLVWLLGLWCFCPAARADKLQEAVRAADSVYFANIEGDYERGLRMADSAFRAINAYYGPFLPQGCREECLTVDGGGEEELKWLENGVKADYHLIMGLRNEVSVAALALCKWEVYGFNNFQFSHLYKLLTKDSSLENFYLRQRGIRSALSVGTALLVMSVVLFAVSAYVVYFRRRILFRFNAMQVLEINRAMLDAAGTDALTDEEETVRRILRAVSSGLKELHAMGGLLLLLRPGQGRKGGVHACSCEPHAPLMNALVERAYETGADAFEPPANVRAYPLLVRFGSGERLCIGAVAMDYGTYRMRKEDFTFERYVVNYLSIMLYESVVLRGIDRENMEQAREERRRALFEESRLRVQNQILDNCLSSIKHETMFYPGRIKHIVHGMKENGAAGDMAERIRTLREVTEYYAEIYTLLCARAARQVDMAYFKCTDFRPAEICEEWQRYAAKVPGHGRKAPGLRVENACGTGVRVYADKVLAVYLLETLTKEWISRMPQTEEKPGLLLQPVEGGRFVRFVLSASWNAFPPGGTTDLFYSGKANYAYLLCKEIIKEQDRLNNFCGCRIEAVWHPKEGCAVWFTLPKYEGGKQI